MTWRVIVGCAIFYFIILMENIPAIIRQIRNKYDSYQ